jgi:ArsR family transcriptional regulator
MAQSKKDQFTKKEIALSGFARAISHPARVAILKTLAKHETCVCGEIVETLPLAQSTVSQHLKELMNAGLIKGMIDGPKSCYCINWETFEEFNAGFSKFFRNAKHKAQKQNCC